MKYSSYTTKENEFYHSQEWREVRQQVLERDMYLCQVCKRNGIIKQGNTVHHIVHLKDDWDKRVDFDNLETICPQCHNKEHEEKVFPKKKYNVENMKKVLAFLCLKRTEKFEKYKFQNQKIKVRVREFL